MGIIKQYIAGLAAAFGAVCLGASIGWSGPMEKPILSGDAYKFKPSADEWGWTSSLLTFGAACMCIPVGILIAVFGRKLVMLVLVAPYLVGWVLIAIASKVFMLFIGRFLLGACGGAFCVTAPMYTTEIAQIETRGVMGCFFQLMIVHGILYGFIVGAYCKPKIVNILCGFLPIVLFVFLFWMPESPVYLVQKGKTEQAEKAMKWLRGADADISGEMNAMSTEAKKEKPKLKEAFSRKATVKGLMIAIVLMLLQQLTGINAILFYATSIFEEAGTGISPELCTIIIGVVQVFSTIAAIVFVDRAGRKMLLMISAGLMGLTTAVMGIYFKFLRNNDVTWLPILAIGLFMVGFSLGFGPVPWLIIAELFAEDIKPVAGSIAGTSSWVFAFIVTKLFPICLRAFGPAVTFWIFTFVSILALVFTLFIVPETKGKTLNEIQGELGGE